jgi:hypothetical protein
MTQRRHVFFSIPDGRFLVIGDMPIDINKPVSMSNYPAMSHETLAHMADACCSCGAGVGFNVLSELRADGPGMLLRVTRHLLARHGKYLMNQKVSYFGRHISML